MSNIIRKKGIFNTYNDLQSAKTNIEVYMGILNICKHVANKTKEVLEDLKYVDRNTNELQDLVALATLQKVLNQIQNREPEVDQEIEIYEILSRESLINLSNDLEKITDKCCLVANYNLTKHTKEIKSLVDNFKNKSDREIIEWFFPEQDLEYCKDLHTVKQYIENKKKKK